jgi:hypothetical protein
MDATASRPPDLRYSKLHFIPEFASLFMQLYGSVIWEKTITLSKYGLFLATGI